MKTVNNRLPAAIKTIVGLTLLGSLTAISGCSHYTSKISSDFKETPQVTHTNMSGAIGCMSQSLQKDSPDNAYIFLIRDVSDGTVKDSSYQDSPLSDSGRVQLLNILSEHLYPHVGLVTDNFPLMFNQMGKDKEGIGLNQFGLPNPKNLQSFTDTYGDIIQSARQSKQMPPASNIIPLVVSGSFTRFDSDNIIQEGSGQNIGSRTKRLADNEEDNVWRKASGQADVGDTSSARAISLVLNLIDPRSNLVVASQSFDLIFYRDNKTFRLRLGLGDGYYGISKDKVTVEGVHGAQQTLLDAAAFWMLNKAYGGQSDFGSCFTTDQQRSLVAPPAAAQPQQPAAAPAANGAAPAQ